MIDSEAIKKLRKIAKDKEGARTPFWLHDLLGAIPLVWRIRNILPPPPSRSAPYHVIHTDPLIIIIPEDVYEYPKQWKAFFDILKEKKVYFLCRIRFTVEDQNTLKIMDYYYNSWMKNNYPKFRFVFLANTINELNLLRKHRLHSIYCNQNCFVDEMLYRPHIITKKYDAVYNARPIPVKNFYLAKSIQNLALITYFISDTERLYFEQLKPELPNATCLNFGDKKLPSCNIKNYKYIKPEDLSKELCKAHVGLCLSEREGANYASIEYLLSGLPVVSISSVGGRDVFFDPNHTFIVEKNPEAVNEAVQHAISLSLSPMDIRKTTLEKINEHRARFVSLLQEILNENGQENSAQEIFEKSFINRMYRTRPISDLKTLIQNH